MTLRSYRIPAQMNAQTVEDELNELVQASPSFEIIEVHDNLVILDDGASLGHTNYTVRRIPPNMDTDEIDALLDDVLTASPSASLLAVHQNLFIFVV